MKKIVVVSSSPRKGGNSETLAHKFAEGAREAGHDVQIVNVREIGLKFCTGCLFCQTHQTCILQDGMKVLYESFRAADTLVFATPVYYYSVSGQLKTFLDRLNPLYVGEKSFREVYLLATAADEDPKAIDGAITAVQGWVDCFDGVALKGVLRAVGVTDRGEIDKTDFPKQAYDMGRAV